MPKAVVKGKKVIRKGKKGDFDDEYGYGRRDQLSKPPDQEKLTEVVSSSALFMRMCPHTHAIHLSKVRLHESLLSHTM